MMKKVQILINQHEIIQDEKKGQQIHNIKRGKKYTVLDKVDKHNQLWGDMIKISKLNSYQ